MSHGDAAQGKDWPRRIGLVLLTLASLTVVAGIVTTAHRGTLFRATNRWGAITLNLMMTYFWFFYRYSGGHPVRYAILTWILLPLFACSAALWLMAVIG